MVQPIPAGCITSSALRMLAIALDRVSAFHRERGGATPGEPCLREIGIELGRPFAVVESGEHKLRLVYSHGSWSFG